MSDPKPTPLLCDSLDFEGRQRVMHLEEYEPEALAWHAAVLERQLAIAVEALEEQRRQMEYLGLPPAFAMTMKRMLDAALAQIKGGSDE